MTFPIERTDSYLSITIKGRLDSLNSRDLKQSVQELLKECNHFLFICNDMDFMDSTGLGALVSSLKYINEANGFLAITGLQAKPRIVFEITRAYKIFNVFDTLEEAKYFLEHTPR